MNSVKWPRSPWVLVAQWIERPVHGFDSCRGVRIFLCPTLVSCWLIHLHNINIVKKIINGDPIIEHCLKIFIIKIVFFHLTGGISLFHAKCLLRIFCQVKIYKGRIEIGTRKFKNVLSVKRCNLKYAVGPRETGNELMKLCYHTWMFLARKVIHNAKDADLTETYDLHEAYRK